MQDRPGEALYFGASDAPLFGCLHAPAGADIAHAALLLPPAGHEYLGAHRSLRQLALRLAEHGCLALRMDFHGCGDSSGAKDSGNLAQWCDDADQGLALLRARAPHAALHLVGVRLGASVAARVAARRANTAAALASVALWDPVSDGNDYLRAALELHRARHGQRQAAQDSGPFEVLGHGLSRQLVSELHAWQLADVTPAPAARVLLLDTRGTLDAAPAAHWRALGAQVTQQTVSAPDLWSGDGQVALIPTNVVQAIAAWTPAP